VGGKTKGFIEPKGSRWAVCELKTKGFIKYTNSLGLMGGLFYIAGERFIFIFMM
jgi:hypothetical protein